MHELQKKKVRDLMTQVELVFESDAWYNKNATQF